MDKGDILIDNIVAWMQEKAAQANCSGIVFGLSGGIDSAVMAGLAKKAFPRTSLGLIMPCHSIEEDEDHARLVAKQFKLDVKKVDLTSTYDTFLKELGPLENKQLAKSNIKPRLRMTSLYYYAQNLGYLVAGPTNKSEFITGYFTKHGDSGVDIMPIGDLLKSQVYELAQALGVPREIIDKVPSAGLWENQSDEEEMGFTYDVLASYIMGEEVDLKLAEKIGTMNKNSQHKRSYPEIYKK